MIAEIKIENHGYLQNQTWKPHNGLNIINGRNGSGKTFLVKELAKQQGKIKYLPYAVQSFAQYSNIDAFAVPQKKPQSTFNEEYKVIEMLAENIPLIQECNSFLRQFNCTELFESAVESGWLFFRNEKCTGRRAVTLETITDGEKTLFILWLILQNIKNYDVLILDEFDAYLSENNCVELYKILDNLANSGLQIFIATHRKIGNWKIVDGMLLTA